MDKVLDLLFLYSVTMLSILYSPRTMYQNWQGLNVLNMENSSFCKQLNEKHIHTTKMYNGINSYNFQKLQIH